LRRLAHLCDPVLILEKFKKQGGEGIRRKVPEGPALVGGKRAGMSIGGGRIENRERLVDALKRAAANYMKGKPKKELDNGEQKKVGRRFDRIPAREWWHDFC